MNEGYFYYVFSTRWPVMLVSFGGIVFAIVRWKRHPKVSGLALAGLILFQLQSVAFSSLYYLLPRLATRGWSWASIDNLSVVLDISHDLLYASSIAVLAAAVFSQRPKHLSLSKGEASHEHTRTRTNALS